ncbi:MAG: 2-oxo acid dehydrogenase subunit E2 [Candidatus Eisenbacteria bacterium]|nr:2-oxo acid dehydrogenase subunit E2 [Candidatus Eisenbacteria bacterium]
MAYDVKLPDIGEGVAEGEIVRWLVKAGEAVREDQPLVEVMTDKATVEIPSPRTGTIEAIHVEEGAMVPVGTVIVSIALAAGEARPAPATAAAPSHAAPPAQAAAGAAAPPVAARVEATPAVRALAKELGVALESVRGTGPGGRITADDVKSARSPASAAASPPPRGPESRQPLRGLRRRIAEHMRHSVSTAAQFTFVAECDFTEIVRHRASVRAKAEAAGVRLTYLAYVFRALPQVLREFPLLNATLDEERQEIVTKGYWHLGLATNTDEGLTVPILHDADRFGLFALAREIERLSAAAREHRLKLEELHGGTFTVTSTGAKGGVLATPILHLPQVAILGVHAITRRPAVVDEQIVIRDLGNLSLSMDHRVVDGAVGADFLYALTDRLQAPAAWLNEGDLR